MTASNEIILVLPESWRATLLTWDAPSRHAYLETARVARQSPRILDWGEPLGEGVVVAAAMDLSVAEVLIKVPPTAIVLAVDNSIGRRRYRIRNLPIGSAETLRRRAAHRVNSWFAPGVVSPTLPRDLTAYLKLVELPRATRQTGWAQE